MRDPQNPDPSPSAKDEHSTQFPTTPTKNPSGAGSADEVIGEDPGAVGPMPFHEAAAGVDETPELQAAPMTEADRAQTQALLQTILGTWNVLVPMARPWWLKCQVFSEPQKAALCEVWEPYAAKYLGAVEPLYVALLATAGIFQANIQAARADGATDATPEPEPEPEREREEDPYDPSGFDPDAEPWPETNPPAMI